MPTTIDVRRADGRFHTRLPWLDSRHSFSFSRHYDPRNVGHGLLLVNNDDVVRAGTGFSTHPHQDMEIVTWVLAGELEHKDSVGNAGVIYPGLAQRMSAGTGIWHSEMNPQRGRGRGRSLRADVGPSRHRAPRSRLRAARRQRRARPGGTRPDRVGPGPRRRHRHPPAGGGAVGRSAAAGGKRHRPRRPPRPCVRRRRAGSHGGHRPGRADGRRRGYASPRRAPPGLVVDPAGSGDAPGGAEVLIWEMGGTA